MSFLAEIRPGFDGDSDTFLFALLRKLHSFLDIGRNVPTEGIMKIPDEIIAILFIQGHESSTHHNELDFINIMADLFQLLYSVPCLNVWIVSGTNRAH
jgi:hypothetical protein